MSFHLLITTPMGQAFDADVDSLSAPGLMGGFEVYSNHEAMVASLKPGPFLIRTSAGVSTLTISDGVLEVGGDHNVLVLTDQVTGK